MVVAQGSEMKESLDNRLQAEDQATKHFRLKAVLQIPHRIAPLPRR
jgi:hypothetical protein